jgi:hypothetical protein
VPVPTLHLSRPLGSGIMMEVTKRRIDFNPPAGVIRQHELSGPWMLSALHRIRKQNEAGDVSIREKRIFGLAKQGVACLQTLGHGCRYEMTSLANIIKLALDFREMSESEVDTLPPSRREEAVKASQVLVACLSFDARKLAGLLDIDVPREPTFGEGIAP